AGTLKPRLRLNDLRELVNAVIGRLQPILAGRRVEVEMADDLPLVSCDYAQIDQVFTNLLENAALHTPASGPVVVRVVGAGDAVRAEVADRGPGLPLADRERLFRPFERGQTRARGSGLGLAIARGFVEAHGGRMWAEETPGGGATFCFELPANEVQGSRFKV